MSELEILTYPDQRLQQQSTEIEVFDEKLQSFINNLEATRLAAPGCVGIAAPQVDEFVRVVIVDVSNNKKNLSHGHLIMVNPEIIEWDGFEVGREGCLSVPDYTGNVIRAKQIKLTAQNEHGEEYTIETEGFEARAIQHEIDHLDGLLFLDRLVSRRNDLFRRKVYKKKEK